MPLVSLCEGVGSAELGALTQLGGGLPGLDALVGALAATSFELSLAPSQAELSVGVLVAVLGAAVLADVQHLLPAFGGATLLPGAMPGDAALLAAAGAAARAYDGFFVAGVVRGAAHLAASVAEPTWAVWLASLDPLLLLLELTLALFLCLSLERLGSLARVAQSQYDDVVTFCKQNGLSLVELAAVLTLGVGFVIFDLFVSAAEDDLTDVLGYGVFALVGLTVAFLVLATDVQLYLLVSAAGSGEATLRSVATDLVNNGLCLLRVFLCWVRYLFYDLQTELVDFTFHYSDLANEATFGALAVGQPWAWAEGAGLAASALLGTSTSVVWLLLSVVLDLTFFLVQLLLGLFKLAIALYLLWLIVDLLLMRPLAWAESTLPRSRR